MTKAANRLPEPSVFYERHHVIPRSLGGSDDPSNVVLLTVHEHFVAHKLLCRVHPNQVFSLKAFLDDTINPKIPERFMHPKLRWTRLLRRQIAYQRASNLREYSRKRAYSKFTNSRQALINQYNRTLQEIDNDYLNTIFDAAGSVQE